MRIILFLFALLCTVAQGTWAQNDWTTLVTVENDATMPAKTS